MRRPQLHRHRLDRIVGLKNRNKVVSLHFHGGFPGNKKGSLDFLDRRRDPGKKTRAEDSVGIGEKNRDLNGARRDIHLTIEEIEFTKLRIGRAIRKLQGETGLFFLLRHVLDALEKVCRSKIFGLGDEEIHFHRIDLRGLGEKAHASTGADEIADLGLSHAGDAIKRSTDRAILQIHLRGLHSGLGGGDAGQ